METRTRGIRHVEMNLSTFSGIGLLLTSSVAIEKVKTLRKRGNLADGTGVKFTAWGNTPDRFYTGSSDGVVKVWNVRTQRTPFVRDILEVPALVSFGKLLDTTPKLTFPSCDQVPSSDIEVPDR
jgi:WD40 repeat protein